MGYSNDGGSPFDHVNDVFVYDQQGRLVPDARLFDQEGNPIQLGEAWCNDPNTGEVNHTRSMGYPYCPDAAPFTSPNLSPDLSPSESPTESPSVGPDATAAPGSTASPSASAATPAAGASSPSVAPGAKVPATTTPPAKKEPAGRAPTSAPTR
jgi:hypothetical protein